MKTRIIASLATMLLALPLMLNAQSPLDKVFSKYAGQDQFTTVNLSKEMFAQFSGMMANSKDTSSLEMKNIMENLSGLRVISYHIDTMNYTKAVNLYNEWTGLFPSPAYKEMMAVTEGRSNYRFLTKSETNGSISELVMLMKGKNEVLVLSLTGTIDMANVSKISRGMGIHGMEGFQKMKEHHSTPPPKK